ncbi:hypothetical protein B0A54_12365 [Friedmanniomyces endolithicus]|uniref:MT-A70-domain-containing protein n=1 Tax=Friedmanniomyces endolithicus TaxID=329885 RepID=A0A4U0UJR8_9PEZI|nr:hypothetical protein B0A54_12365 [Friedmanniomyces endolithicus]
MVDSILWQSEASDVTLIDIPRSIAAAQGTVQHPCHELLSSNEPLKVPFRSNEPKSATAKTKLCAGDVEQELQREYANICVEALAQVKAKWSGDWCLPRLSVATGKPAAKRKHDDERPKAHMNATRVSQPLELYKPLLQGPDDDAQSRVLTVTNHGITASATLVANLNERPIVLPVSTDHVAGADRYCVPPGSSFCLGDCHNARDLRAALRAQAEQRDGRKTFDFILLDPPWPNRSVKRTHKTAGSTYNTAANLRDVEDLLLGMDLDMLMADECLIGVWITNKQAIRALILDEGGLFDSWGVQLVEEWIWVKTTVQGKPVMPIDGLWRKPYEVLLLGRNQKSNCSHNTNGSAEVDIRRRVLMGVPDLHSRKPCLKELVEPLLSSNDSYRALEVFARYLVAGWWSWGNECIKFNSGECWEEPEAQEQSTD